MGSPPILDLDQLLQPVSGDNPCGENLRWDPVHDEIKKARQEESKDMLATSEPTQANWRLVAEKASDVLTRRSKDLMIAAYLQEALIQLHGFAGLRDGLKLINGLLENFWDGLYPPIDGEDLEPRSAPLIWLAEADRGSRLPNRIRDIPLTPSSDDGRIYSFAFSKSRFAQAKGENEDVDVYERRRVEAEERGKQFEDAIGPVPLTYYANLWDDVGQATAELSRLSKLLDEKFGRQAPGTSALRQSIDECGALVRRILKDKGGLQEPGEAGTEAMEGAGEGEGGARVVRGPLKSRADALRRLADVAAFFRQTEPHSPISYLVERAASWGNMSLEDLLNELVKDPGVRDQIAELLAFKRSSE